MIKRDGGREGKKGEKEKNIKRDGGRDGEREGAR